jgi:hypothetical protein
MAGEVDPVGGEQLVGAVVLQRGPFQLEEEQPGLDARLALLELLE